jgi:uncharacterized lipoprotein YbaY
MAFRSLVLVSFLLAGCAAKSVQTEVQPNAIAAVNQALGKKELVLSGGVPILK